MNYLRQLCRERREDGFTLTELAVASLITIGTGVFATQAIITSFTFASTQGLRTELSTAQRHVSNYISSISSPYMEVEDLTLRTQGCGGEVVQKQGIPVNVSEHVCVEIGGDTSHYVIEAWSATMDGEGVKLVYDSKTGETQSVGL